MNTPIYINSSKARGNFSNILNSVFTDKKTFVIKKSGIPMAKLVSLETDCAVGDDFMNFAGMLTKKESDKILKMVRKERQDGSRLKKKLI